MTAPRGLAVDRDDLRGTVAEVFDPGQETGFEQAWIDGRKHVTHGVVTGNTVLIREKPAEKRLIFLTPQRRLNKIIGPGDRRGERQEEDFDQRIQHFRMLAWVFQRGEMAQDRRGLRL